jgi:hypothetical protein
MSSRSNSDSDEAKAQRKAGKRAMTSTYFTNEGERMPFAPPAPSNDSDGDAPTDPFYDVKDLENQLQLLKWRYQLLRARSAGTQSETVIIPELETPSRIADARNPCPRQIRKHPSTSDQDEIGLSSSGGADDRDDEDQSARLARDNTGLLESRLLWISHVGRVARDSVDALGPDHSHSMNRLIRLMHEAVKLGELFYSDETTACGSESRSGDGEDEEEEEEEQEEEEGEEDDDDDSEYSDRESGGGRLYGQEGR